MFVFYPFALRDIQSCSPFYEPPLSLTMCLLLSLLCDSLLCCYHGCGHESLVFPHAFHAETIIGIQIYLHELFILPACDYISTYYTKIMFLSSNRELDKLIPSLLCNSMPYCVFGLTFPFILSCVFTFILHFGEHVIYNLFFYVVRYCMY